MLSAEDGLTSRQHCMDEIISLILNMKMTKAT